MKLSGQKYAKKIHRFYLYTNFENKVDPRFKRKNEVEGNVWIGVDKSKNYFLQSKKKYINCSELIAFIKKNFILGPRV